MGTERTFEPRLRQVYFEITAVILGGTVFLICKGFSLFLLWFLAGYLAYRLLLFGGVFKKVILRDDGLEIVPLFPWFKRRRWKSEDLATYKSAGMKGIWGRNVVLCGVVNAKDGQHEVLFPNGTEQFEALDNLLKQLLPEPKNDQATDSTKT